MADYQKDNDYELLYLANENDEIAKNMIFEKYQPLINNKARRLYKFAQNKGIEMSDLIQEGMIGLSEAIHDFNENQGVLFFTFASLCIERQMNSLMLKINRNKHKILNESLSLDYIDDDLDKPLISLIKEDHNNPEDSIISLEEEQEMYQRIKESLTDFEQSIFELKLHNFSYREIAQILDKDHKSIDNAIQRIKNKIKKIIK